MLPFTAPLIAATVLMAADIQPPPARYDHAPTVRMQVIEGTKAQIQRVCRMASGYHGGRHILSCAIPSKGLCIIVWPRGMKRSGWLWKHERAHCNGWRH